VFVFPDRIEIGGTIPTQVLKGEEPEKGDSIAPIIKSATGIKGMGYGLLHLPISSG
jgi:hypothetical protein